uniref:Fe2OG dioxygenase domain-containing protein n=1 Tax=Chaetoceros debilis TaxID=122233 RepID=A0A7S3PTI8_9STRA
MPPAPNRKNISTAFNLLKCLVAVVTLGTLETEGALTGALKLNDHLLQTSSLFRTNLSTRLSFATNTEADNKSPNPYPYLVTVQQSPYPPVYNGANPTYPNIQLIHEDPPIYTVPDFLSHSECDFLIAAAQDCFIPAPIIGKEQDELSTERTSSTCYFTRDDFPDYLSKVSLLTGQAVENCEWPQVGRYLPSQQYHPHFDALDLSSDEGQRASLNGGQRIVTVLAYLNDIQAGRGGQTDFPKLNNLQIQPKKGMALVFFPASMDCLVDLDALHAAKPAMDTKYISQV